jgi:hypothetical protein
MAKVSKEARPLAGRVADLERQVRSLSEELRTRRIVVTDERNRPVVVLEARGDAGLAIVCGRSSEIRIDAGTQGHPVLDVLSGSGADGVGIHFYADNRDDAVGIAASRGGDVTLDNQL